MPTLHLIIVCVTVLALAMLAARNARERRPSLSELGNVLAGQIAAAIAGKQNALLQAQLDAQQQIVANTKASERETPALSRRGETVAVRTRPPDATTVRGVVVAEHADRIVLRDALVYDGSAEGRAANGELEILLINISTIQAIPPRTEPA